MVTPKLRLFGLKCARKGHTLHGPEPNGIVQCSRNCPPPDKSPDPGRQPFQNEHHVPVGITQDQPGDRPRDHRPNRHAESPQSEGPRTLRRHEPLREQHRDRSEDRPLGGAEQEAHRQQLRKTLREAGAHRAGAPDKKRAEDNLPCPEPRREPTGQQVGDEIAPEEDTAGESRLCRREMQIVRHARQRQADIDAIEEGDGVDKKHDGNEAHPTDATVERQSSIGHCTFPRAAMMPRHAVFVLFLARSSVFSLRRCVLA